MRFSREVGAIAVPAIISNVTTPLLGLADTAVTGHMGGAAYVAAIALGGSMFSLSYWPMGFLRMGTSGLAAQAYGASDTARQRIILWRSLTLGSLLSLAIVILSPWLAHAFLSFLDAGADASALARRYFIIVAWGAPAVLGSYSLSGWMLGMQDSRGPMWMALLTNLTNIAISVVLVFGFGMGIEGVAVGTLSAQWMGFMLGVALVRAKLGRLRFPGVRALFEGGALRRYFNVNADIFLRTLLLAAVTIWFTRMGASGGQTVLAANALLLQFFILFSYFADGFAYAGEALAGKYLGAGDKVSLGSTIRTLFVWGAIIAVAFMAAYAIGGSKIIWLLTDEMSVVEQARRYLPWVVFVPACGVGAFIWDGIFIGMSKTRQMLIAMVVAAAAFFALCAILIPLLGNHGLWIAFLAYLALRGCVSYLLRR